MSTDFDRVQYNGRKPYPDPLLNATWAPGQIRFVPARIATKLLRFAEFDRVTVAAASAESSASATLASTEGAAGAQGTEGQSSATGEAASGDTSSTPNDTANQAALEEAQARENEARRQAEAQRQELEQMLASIGTWDKDALADYAEKYELKLDKRKAVQALREQVSTAVEQFGVR
ncbi:hypothetical protein ABIC63_000513 [Pseudacidovorax sp. 1753]|uniref:hypothetical protein n=1 Tax=Pseudacidovorax sp. 1753 TaxID=3156419 RepID=UPI0033960EB4